MTEDDFKRFREVRAKVDEAIKAAEAAETRAQAAVERLRRTATFMDSMPQTVQNAANLANEDVERFEDVVSFGREILED